MAALTNTTTDPDGPAPASPERLLRIYLDDHWAASGAAVRLADRMAGTEHGPDHEAPVARLRDHLRDDDRTLATIRELLAIDTGGWKRRAAAAAEMIGRLKPNGRAVRPSPLSRVLELEAVSAHLVATRALWQALRQLDDPRLAGIDLTGLELRTEVQLGVLHDLHHRAVDTAFGLDDAPRSSAAAPVAPG